LAIGHTIPKLVLENRRPLLPGLKLFISFS
jgi:hypothetical protein